jgi:signal transduction histidine kinase
MQTPPSHRRTDQPPAAPDAMGQGSPRRRWGIAQGLVVVVLVVLVPFVGLEVLRGVQDVTERSNSVSERTLGQVEQEAETMEDFVRYTERYLATLAADPALRALDLPRINALFQAVQDLNPNYINVFLVAPGGGQLASTTPGVSDPQITERPYFREALESGRVAISDALTWRDSGRSAVVLSQRVTGDDGSVVGVLSLALNVARLSNVIGFVPLPPDSVVLLVQHDGTIIAASHNPEGWVGQSLATTENFADLWTERTNTETMTMPDGITRVVSSHVLRASPWLMIAGIPEREVDAAVRDSILRVAVQLALAGIVTALLAWIVLRRVVLPIRVLSEGARAFAAGYLHRRIPLARTDELGELADALNRMATALEQRLEEAEAHQRALEQLNHLQAEFVATASHELRTPVTAIRTYAEALMRPDISDEATRRDCLAGIDRASDRLARLARTLLDVARVDQGQVPVQLAAVDVATVVHAAVGQLDLGSAGRRVLLDVPDHLPPARADPDRLEDVLANLVGNALKFSPPDQPVRVYARSVGDHIELAVADLGPGIAAAEQARIFDRFYQVARGADRPVGGSGLGLYIARGYITAMQGELRLDSAPGQGSTFTVVLPIAATAVVRTDGAAAAGAADTAAVPTAGGGRR